MGLGAKGGLAPTRPEEPSRLRAEAQFPQPRSVGRVEGGPSDVPTGGPARQPTLLGGNLATTYVQASDDARYRKCRRCRFGNGVRYGGRSPASELPLQG